MLAASPEKMTRDTNFNMISNLQNLPLIVLKAEQNFTKYTVFLVYFRHDLYSDIDTV